MYYSVNKAIILGSVDRVPEVRYVSGEQVMAKFSVGTTERWTDSKTGGTKETMEWHAITVLGRLAELCGRHLAKGQKVYIEGRLQCRERTDRAGQRVNSIEILAHQVVFLEGQDERRPDSDLGATLTLQGAAKPETDHLL